jgi:hypothetical protein
MTKLAMLAVRVLMVCAGFVAPCAAAPITFAFTGTVTSVTGNPLDTFGGGNMVGTSFSGSYTFESTSVDQIAMPNSGAYASPAGAPYHFTAVIGGRSFSVSDLLTIGIVNDINGHDLYTAVGCSTFDCVQAGWRLNLFLQDNDRNALGSDALPVFPPSLSHFEIATFSFHLPVDGNQVELRGELSSLTAVPEPGTLLLIAPALAFLGRRRLRRTLPVR